jgi:hypothetical protein
LRGAKADHIPKPRTNTQINRLPVRLTDRSTGIGDGGANLVKSASSTGE